MPVVKVRLTITPMLLAGPARRIAHGPAEPAPLGLHLAGGRGPLHDNGTLLLRYVRSTEGAHP